MPNKPMLTPPIHRHPWTRVSWISGSSDIDDLDEEEVQEVESITLGRAFSNDGTSAATGTGAATNVVDSTNTDDDDDDVKTQRVCNYHSVTLKPFSFESSVEREDSENSSVLAPFAFQRDAKNNAVQTINTENNDAVTNKISPYGILSSPQKDVLVSQKGHLITPAAADAATEEEGEDEPSKQRYTWKTFWQEAPAAEAPAAEAPVVETVKTVEVNEDEDGHDVVVEPEDAEVRIFARAKLYWAASKEKAKDYFDQALDGFFWLWFSCAIKLTVWMKKSRAATKDLFQGWTGKAKGLWETKVVSTIGLTAAPLVCGLGLVFVAVAFLLPAKRTPSPTHDLREFVRFEKANNIVDLKVIDELNTEAFRTFARSTCVEAETYEQARAALDIGLFGVPDSVRNTVVQMAVLEGVTQKNSIQDSNSDFVSSGMADAFMAFWSTVYEEEGYKSCVMVTGVALTVAETVAEWTTKREKYQVGTEPCHCGYVYCEECPVFDVREVKWPIFERRSLSLKKQQELRHWMIDQAVRSAEHLVLDGSDKLTLGSSSAVATSPRFAWTGQSSSAFFGEDSHRDRAASSSSSVDESEETEQEL